MTATAQPTIANGPRTQFAWERKRVALSANVTGAWIKAHVPAEMAPVIARGMEEARFQVALKSSLVPAMDSYLQARSDKSNPAALE